MMEEMLWIMSMITKHPIRGQKRCKDWFSNCCSSSLVDSGGRHMDLDASPHVFRLRFVGDRTTTPASPPEAVLAPEGDMPPAKPSLSPKLIRATGLASTLGGLTSGISPLSTSPNPICGACVSWTT